MHKLEYIVPSRIAIDLYDMNGDLGRIDGSMGFSLESPCLRFTAYRSSGISLKNGKILGEELRAAVEKGLKLLQKFHRFDGITIDFHESIPLHVGLGSKTATLLSLGHAYSLLHEKKMDFRDLGIFLGRGGTSGLGINLIDKGGFIVDGGHSTYEKKRFMPSSASYGVSAPPILARYYMPDWKVLIVIPALPRVHSAKERAFFKKTCPVPGDDVARLARVRLSQVMPSVAESNLHEFCEGINAVQKTIWKSSEIGIYGSCVRDLLASLRQQGALGVGMSSIGPGVYAFGGDLERIAAKMDVGCFMVKVTHPNNTGIKINQ